jgi:hypothetical protein
MDHIILVVAALALGLFLGMLLFLEIGYRVGVRRLAKEPETARAGLGTVEGAIFALLGLLIAFTFSGAAARFDARRQLIIQETNAIGTAYLRIDLLPADAQPAMRDLFRRYIDTRLAAYKKLPDIAAAKEELARATSLQNEIWRGAVAACQKSSSPQAVMLVMPALNEMIDIAGERTLVSQMHPPFVIFALLGVMALGGATLAGYGMAGGKSRSWIHWIGFALVMSVTFFVILDIEFPRFGLIRVDTFDQALVDLRQSLK